MLGVVVGVLAVGGGGVAAYWFAGRHTHPSSPSHSSHAAVQQQSVPPAPPSASTASSTKQYVSNGHDLNLSFTYPSDWTVTPPTGSNTSDQPITVTSSLQSITNNAGGTVTGKVVVSIRPGSAQVSELASGTAVVTQDSVQFAYSKPTASQHQYPYLTYIRLSGGATAANGFDEVIITGITKFMKGQNISAESLGQLDPIISATFYHCVSESCNGTGATTVSITNDTWLNAAIFKQVQSLFQSLMLS